MRFVIQVLIALIFVAAGVLFGALNPETVHIDFRVFQLSGGLGVALLAALLIGAALGGLAVTVGIVWRLQRRLRKAQRDAATAVRSSQQQSASLT